MYLLYFTSRFTENTQISSGNSCLGSLAYLCTMNPVGSEAVVFSCIPWRGSMSQFLSSDALFSSIVIQHWPGQLVRIVKLQHGLPDSGSQNIMSFEYFWKDRTMHVMQPGLSFMTSSYLSRDASTPFKIPWMKLFNVL